MGTGEVMFQTVALKSHQPDVMVHLMAVVSMMYMMGKYMAFMIRFMYLKTINPLKLLSLLLEITLIFKTHHLQGHLAIVNEDGRANLKFVDKRPILLRVVPDGISFVALKFFIVG
jgi:hypothetical protein